MAYICQLNWNYQINLIFDSLTDISSILLCQFIFSPVKKKKLIFAYMDTVEISKTLLILEDPTQIPPPPPLDQAAGHTSPQSP